MFETGFFGTDYFGTDYWSNLDSPVSSESLVVFEGREFLFEEVE